MPTIPTCCKELCMDFPGNLIEKTYPDMSRFGRRGVKIKTNILDLQALFTQLFTSTLSRNYFEK